MTYAFELAELIRNAARGVLRAENLCDAVTVRVEQTDPLVVSAQDVRLPDGAVCVCSGVSDALRAGTAALAVRAAGGRRYYIIDTLTEAEE